jgi:hypothetical protein
MGRGKNTRKKNMKHKLNKRKSKKVQDGGADYEVFVNKINNATNEADIQVIKDEYKNGNGDPEQIRLLNSIADKKSAELQQPILQSATDNDPENQVDQVKDVTVINQTDVPVAETDLKDQPGAQLVVPSDSSPSAPDVKLGPIVDDLINLIPLDKQSVGQIQNKIQEVQSLKNAYNDRKLTADELEELNNIGKTYNPIGETVLNNFVVESHAVDSDAVVASAISVNASPTINPSGKICVEGSTSAHQLFKVPLNLVEKVKQFLQESCDIQELVYDANGNVIR